MKVQSFFNRKPIRHNLEINFDGSRTGWRHVHNQSKQNEVGECRRSAIRDQRQSNAGNRNQTDDHSQILNLLVEQHCDRANNNQPVARNFGVIGHLAEI